MCSSDLTTSKTEMYSAPDVDASEIGSIPPNVILEPLEGSSQQPGDYLHVAYKKKVGWVFKVEVKRYMETPAPDIQFSAIGYKIVDDSVYRYFFLVRNDGTLPYSGKLTLRLFDADGKITAEKITDFSAKPIRPDTGGSFPFDSLTTAPRYELEYDGGTIKGSTGVFIERIYTSP